jgi:hypothetical protein
VMCPVVEFPVVVVVMVLPTTPATIKPAPTRAIIMQRMKRMLMVLLRMEYLQSKQL